MYKLKLTRNIFAPKLLEYQTDLQNYIMSFMPKVTVSKWVELSKQIWPKLIKRYHLCSGMHIKYEKLLCHFSFKDESKSVTPEELQELFNKTYGQVILRFAWMYDIKHSHISFPLKFKRKRFVLVVALFLCVTHNQLERTSYRMYHKILYDDMAPHELKDISLSELGTHPIFAEP